MSDEHPSAGAKPRQQTMPLDYRSPRDDLRPSAESASIDAAAMLMVLTLLGLGAIWFGIMFNRTYESRHLKTIDWLVGGGTTLFALAGWGAAFYVKRRDARIRYGALIGFVIFSVIVGVLFVVNILRK